MAILLGFGSFSVDLNLLADELEGKAGEYNKKLEEYERGELDALKKELRLKRVQVVAALKQEMDKATKQGELEGALAIKKEIERLKGKIDLAAIGSLSGNKNERLEGKAGEYNKKLEEYERGELDALKKELWLKRVQVVGLFQAEMVKVSKQGNLEGALAIKKEIERLKGEIDLAAIGSLSGNKNEAAKAEGEAGNKKSKSAMRKDFEKKLVGRKWKDPNGFIYQLEKRGKALMTVPGKPAQIWKWEVTEPGKVKFIYSSANSVVFIFGEEGEDVIKEWYDGSGKLLNTMTVEEVK